MPSSCKVLPELLCGDRYDLGLVRGDLSDDRLSRTSWSVAPSFKVAVHTYFLHRTNITPMAH